MALHLVLLTLTLAVSLVSTQHCASSVGSRVDLFLHGHKNATGHWIITVDNRRFTSTENQWEVGMNVHQERSCDSNEIEHLVSVTSVFPPLQDSSIEPTPTPPAAATTTRPKSCPHSEYRLFPEFNCYKAFANEGKSWSDARAVCRRDGGDLMVVETERERKEVFVPLYNTMIPPSTPWMGVYIPEGGQSWMSVKGEPALSTWWQPNDPYQKDEYKCAGAYSTGHLWKWTCGSGYPFICEIPL